MERTWSRDCADWNWRERNLMLARRWWTANYLRLRGNQLQSFGSHPRRDVINTLQQTTLQLDCYIRFAETVGHSTATSCHRRNSVVVDQSRQVRRVGQYIHKKRDKTDFCGTPYMILVNLELLLTVYDTSSRRSAAYMMTSLSSGGHVISCMYSAQYTAVTDNIEHM